MEFGGEKFTNEIVVVSPLTSEAILGLDFLQKQQACIDLTSRRLHLKQSGCDIPLQDPMLLHTTSGHNVCSTATVEIPPRSTMHISGSTDTPLDGAWLLEGTNDKHTPFVVARALIEPTSSVFPVRLLNPTEEPVTVYARTVLATLQKVELPVSDVIAASGNESVPVVKKKEQEMLLKNLGLTLTKVKKNFFITCCFHMQISWHILSQILADRQTTAPYSYRECNPNKTTSSPCPTSSSK